MLSVSVTRVRRSGAFGVVVVVVAIVILFTCCDIAKWFMVPSRALISVSGGTIVMREKSLPDDHRHCILGPRLVILIPELRPDGLLIAL